MNKELLEFLKEHERIHDNMPTLREIAARMGWNSPVSSRNALHKLIDARKIEYYGDAGKYRFTGKGAQ